MLGHPLVKLECERENRNAVGSAVQTPGMNRNVLRTPQLRAVRFLAPNPSASLTEEVMDSFHVAIMPTGNPSFSHTPWNLGTNGCHPPLQGTLPVSSPQTGPEAGTF